MSVTVRSGDTMWGIARQHGVRLDDLIRANPQIGNPDLIYPGQRLTLPGWDHKDVFEAPPAQPAPGSGTVTVRSGDTMWGVARRAGVSLSALIDANPQVRNPNLIFPGQVLNLPGGDGPHVDPAPAPVEPPSHRPRGDNPYLDAFARAARTAGVPTAWASDPELIQLVQHESGFRPGVKNPHSTAFGLFQFLDSTWRSYLPEVPYGTVDPYWQAVGGFRYIQARYGTPERAWAFWRATVNENPELAPPDLRGLVRIWIERGYKGY